MTEDSSLELNNPVSTGEDDLRQYLSEIRRIPRLTAEQERELAMRCAAGDEDAIRRMVDSNLRLVVSVAADYAGRGVPLLDLIQEGSIGLLIAAKRYDYTRDLRFSTYATKWIFHGISKCLANHGIIRVPAHTAERIKKIYSARTEYIARFGEEPSLSVLSQQCGIPEKQISKLLELDPEVCSLDTPLGDDADSTLASVLEDTQESTPYESFVREELATTLDLLMQELDERQRKVLRLRFGMENGLCYSYADIGNLLGISKERVRQIEKQAVDKLHTHGAAVGLEDYLE